MILKSNNKFIVLLLFIILMMVLATYHTIESVKNPPIAKTNKTEYNVNEKILLEIENKLPQQIIIRGCEMFVVQEKKENGDWINNSDGVTCSSDETIRIFAKRKSVIDFITKKPGKYRIFIDYKMYRKEAQRLDVDRPSHLPKLYSNEFSVK